MNEFIQRAHAPCDKSLRPLNVETESQITLYCPMSLIRDGYFLVAVQTI
jgi:hypothetical protein